MLEVVISNPSDRRGEGKIDTSGAFNGTFCYLKGFDKDGYTLLDLPGSSAQGAAAIYPINKYYYPEDLSDTSDAVDKRTKGDNVVYFTGNGEYITNKWIPSTFGLTAAYWSGVEGGLSSAFGAKITSPGTSTAAVTVGVGNHKAWVSTAVGKVGWLSGTSQSIAGGTIDAQVGYVGRVIRFFGQDSANSFVHVRLTPNRTNPIA